MDYKKVKPLTPLTVGYLAGLIDGEGTVTLTRKHRRENRQLAITISSTERKVLEYVLGILGAGKITRKRVYQAHHLPSYTYAIYNRQALQVLAWIQPNLQTYKAKRAELILSQYVSLTPRNGKYSENQRIQREAFIDAVLSIKPAGTALETNS